LFARRFLYIVAVLIVLVIAGAFAYRMLAPDLMRAALVPEVSFAESPTSPPTFYDRPDAWLARPGIPGEDAHWVPAGYQSATQPGVAVFYVHPTTYLKRDRWNAPIDIHGDARFRQSIFVKSQASVFNGIGEIWAPKYRQATFGAFLSLGNPNAEKAFELAYTDVEKAFDTFLKEVPPDQPNILAGHSQGSLQLVNLLARRIAGTPIERRIVAAYLGGWPISVEHDLPKLGLPACTAPDQTGCILAWQSFAEPAEPDYIFDRFLDTIGLDGEPREGSTLLCTNPLTGGTPEAAEPERNIGTMIPTDDDTFEDATIEPALVGAKCTEKGYLSIGEHPPEGLQGYVLPGNNYHVYDYALFWGNLRADVERRVQAMTGEPSRVVAAE
jgi:hypothetical protein